MPSKYKMSVSAVQVLGGGSRESLSPPPVAPPSPDISHLTPEELRILTDVIKRQEQFERQEQERVSLYRRCLSTSSPVSVYFITGFCHVITGFCLLHDRFLSTSLPVSVTSSPASVYVIPGFCLLHYVISEIFVCVVVVSASSPVCIVDVCLRYHRLLSTSLPVSVYFMTGFCHLITGFCLLHYRFLSRHHRLLSTSLPVSFTSSPASVNVITGFCHVIVTSLIAAFPLFTTEHAEGDIYPRRTNEKIAS
ncbi:hypothetical protein BaRGS_00032684, partial [Batillaria attramentaria]